MTSSPFAFSQRPFYGTALLATLGLIGLTSSAVATTYPASTAAQLTSALSSVQPGDTIALSGTITSSAKFSTTRAGTSAAPITIQGDGTAVLTGSSSYGLEILHDYYRLNNFVIKNAAKGLVIDNANHGAADHVHVMDIVQEGFKIRNQSQFWAFTFCSARRTGTSGDFGEGFYVGQASSNWIGGTPDRSGYVTFFNCYTTDTVNDGWDMKEGAHHVKLVNCTADFSGSIEPVTNAAHGSAGVYIRCDNVQVIKGNVVNLNNGDWAYRFSNQTVNSVDYGSTGNELKQSAVNGGNVGLVFSEGGTNARVYTDYIENSSGGFYATGSNTVATPAPSTFVEMTWSGEGGGLYGGLDSTIGADGDPMSAPPPVQVAAPGFSPGGGSYTSTQSVTITSATSGASIRYTLDGSTPTSTTGTLYSSAVTIAATATLKAIAYKSGMTDSTVTAATYTITAPSQVAAPSFNPGGGGYTAAQSVTITSATSGASIRYTLDGSTPTSTTGTLYSSAVTIAATATLKAIAYKSGMTDSTVTAATYTISTGGGGGTQNISVAASSDDAKERTDTSSGTMNLTSSLPFGNAGSTYIVGVRFTGVNIPAGAVITAATIQFTAHAAGSVATSLTVRGQKSTNAATFTTTGHDITNRVATTASVGWTVPTWTNDERGTPEKTPDLKTIVQEIVNQTGWVAGRPIVFTLAGTGDRAAKAFDSGAANAATLHVEWQ